MKSSNAAAAPPSALKAELALAKAEATIAALRATVSDAVYERAVAAAREAPSVVALQAKLAAATSSGKAAATPKARVTRARQRVVDAAQHGHLGKLRRRLAYQDACGVMAGAGYRTDARGMFPLHLAAEAGHADVVAFLVQRERDRAAGKVHGPSTGAVDAPTARGYFAAEVAADKIGLCSRVGGRQGRDHWGAVCALLDDPATPATRMMLTRAVLGHRLDVVRRLLPRMSGTELAQAKLALLTPTTLADLSASLHIDLPTAFATFLGEWLVVAPEHRAAVFNGTLFGTAFKAARIITHEPGRECCAELLEYLRVVMPLGAVPSADQATEALCGCLYNGSFVLSAAAATSREILRLLLRFGAETENPSKLVRYGYGTEDVCTPIEAAFRWGDDVRKDNSEVILSTLLDHSPHANPPLRDGSTVGRKLLELRRHPRVFAAKLGVPAAVLPLGALEVACEYAVDVRERAALWPDDGYGELRTSARE